MFHNDWSSSVGDDINKKLGQIGDIRTKFCSIQLRQNQKLYHCHSH